MYTYVTVRILHAAKSLSTEKPVDYKYDTRSIADDSKFTGIHP